MGSHQLDSLLRGPLDDDERNSHKKKKGNGFVTKKKKEFYRVLGGRRWCRGKQDAEGFGPSTHWWVWIPRRESRLRAGWVSAGRRELYGPPRPTPALGTRQDRNSAGSCASCASAERRSRLCCVYSVRPLETKRERRICSRWLALTPVKKQRRSFQRGREREARLPSTQLPRVQVPHSRKQQQRVWFLFKRD